MRFWKTAPRAKVYEALTAIADGRVLLTSATTAQVTSSSRDRTYDVSWSEARQTFSSNDNASYFVGYAGYPIIAVLLLLGVIPYNVEIAGELAGIPWKQINTKHKNNWDAAVEDALASYSPERRAKIADEVSRIYVALSELRLTRG